MVFSAKRGARIFLALFILFTLSLNDLYKFTRRGNVPATRFKNNTTRQREEILLFREILSKFRPTFSDHFVRSPYGISEKILAHNDESLTFHRLETFRGTWRCVFIGDVLLPRFVDFLLFKIMGNVCWTSVNVSPRCSTPVFHRRLKKKERKKRERRRKKKAQQQNTEIIYLWPTLPRLCPTMGSELVWNVNYTVLSDDMLPVDK